MIPALTPTGSSLIASPLAISGCIGWFDASDAATVSTSGGVVTQWDNKATFVGLTSIVPPTNAQRPSYQSAVQAGKNIIRYDGVDDVLVRNVNDLFSASTGWTLFVVSRPSSITNEQYNVDIKFTLGGGDAIYCESLPTTGFSAFGGRRLNGAGAAQSQADTTARSTSVFQTVSAIAILGSTLTLYNNGVQTAQKATYLTAGGMSSDVYHLAIGAAADGSATPALPFVGDMAEVVFYSVALSTTNHAKVVAYLKAKWGL